MEKSRRVLQMYEKKAPLQPGWVSINVPEPVAECLKEFNFRERVLYEDLLMILNSDVIDNIKSLLDEPIGMKKHFDELLMRFLDLATHSDMILYYDKEIHYLLNSIRGILSSAVNYLESKPKAIVDEYE